MAECLNELQPVKVAVGIVTYNPDLVRLGENLDAILPQTHRVFIFDNASRAQTELESFISDYDGTQGNAAICLIKNFENAGMAVALNSLCRKALEEGDTHILLLDQDSVAESNIVATEKQYALDGVGIVCPQIIDRNEHEERNDASGVYEVGRTITAGSLVNLRAFQVTGGYDERLFLDWVDFDFCINLTLHGYRILKTTGTSVLHEVGHKELAGRAVVRDHEGNLVLRPYYRTNHSRERRYDKARSMTIIIGKYASTPMRWKVRSWVIKSIIRDLVHEKRRLELIQDFSAGHRDGKKMPI